MAEAHELDPFVNTEQVEEEEEELRILDERDTDDETEFVSFEEAREHIRQWLSESPSKKVR